MLLGFLLDMGRLVRALGGDGLRCAGLGSGSGSGNGDSQESGRGSTGPGSMKTVLRFPCGVKMKPNTLRSPCSSSCSASPAAMPPITSWKMGDVCVMKGPRRFGKASPMFVLKFEKREGESLVGVEFDGREKSCCWCVAEEEVGDERNNGRSSEGAAWVVVIVVRGSLMLELCDCCCIHVSRLDLGSMPCATQASRYGVAKLGT